MRHLENIGGIWGSNTDSGVYRAQMGVRAIGGRGWCSMQNEERRGCGKDPRENEEHYPGSQQSPSQSFPPGCESLAGRD